MKRLRVTVCRGPECGARSPAITQALRDHIATLGLDVELDQQSCFGRCRSGPNMVVGQVDTSRPRRGFGLAAFAGAGPSTMYNHLSPDVAIDILERHIERLRTTKREP